MRMTRCCANPQCCIAMPYVDPKKIKEANGRVYCSLKCLRDQYATLSYDGAIHLVHQKFGPDHPVTKQIQKMRKELADFRKKVDLDDRKYIGKMKRLGVYNHEKASIGTKDSSNN
jgi:hypothetical protein